MNQVNTLHVTLPKAGRLMFESSLREQLSNSNKIQKLMKTTFYIIVAFFGLQSNLLFASGTSAQSVYSDLLPYPSIEVMYSPAEMPAISAASLKELAPVIPSEADFSDNDLFSPSVTAISTLTPVSPKEADFDDSDADNLNLLTPELAPKTPAEADFLDEDIIFVPVTGNLTPSVPEEATFEEELV